ncbi:MAG: XRE family transcriptional regulator, partial [Candidatus Spyradocola sp.]
PLDSTIASICREFNVNETWLRTGEGSMFNETDSGIDLVTRAMLGQSENKKKLIRLIADMPDDLLDKMMEYLEGKKK